MVATMQLKHFMGALAGSLVFATATAGSAAKTPSYPDADASDPARLGWMVGSPPPPDRMLRFEDGSYFQFPALRWSVSHFRQLMPTVNVSRGLAPAVPLPQAPREDIDELRFTPLGASQSMTWRDSLKANYTDGIVVLHKGRVVYERYFGVLKPEGQHGAMSVTKSFVGTLAAVMAAEGQLDPSRRVAEYVPELAASAFGNATVRQLMDMTTGIRFSEDYADPQGVHGKAFGYRTANTDALGWVLARVSGQSVADLLSERIWSRLGAEQDAYMSVDSTGTPFAGGGLNLGLRDLARFGEMIRNRGQFNGQQIVPAEAVDDIRRGGDAAAFAKAGYRLLPGWTYRNMWWVTHNAHGAFAARGVHGQTIYIDPKAQMVIARFASHPVAGNAANDPTSLPAYEALGRLLAGER
jgi:CubicO group peptidase (beta-lactamase class C family)